MNNIIYLLVCLLFFSCSNPKRESQQEMTSFPIEKSLQAEKIEVNEVFNPSGLMWKRNSLFVSDVLSNDTMIYQYSLPYFNCIYKGGSKGQAEDEFQSIPIFCRTTTDKVYIWGFTPFSIKSFTMDNFDLSSFSKKYELPISTDTYNDMHIVRDSILIMEEVTQLAIKKINLNNQQVIGEISFEKDDHGESFFCENAGNMIANDSLIIYAYMFKNQIDFYDMDDMKLKKRLIGDNIAPKIVLYDVENTIYRQFEILAGKNYFYVRCPVRKNSNKECEIKVFDYSGNSIARYELDAMLHAYAVDEQNKVIYGYNRDAFEGIFLKYCFQ